jgi:hypothetical protein
MYRLKLRIRFVLSDKIAKQKTWFLLCSAACGGAPGLSARRPVRCIMYIFKRYSVLAIFTLQT